MSIFQIPSPSHLPWDQLPQARGPHLSQTLGRERRGWISVRENNQSRPNST